MRISFGYELVFACPQPTPMMLMLHTHPSRAHDLIIGDRLMTDPSVPVRTYLDGFGNRCSRLVAPAGRTRITATGIMQDSGKPEPAAWDAGEADIDSLPDDVLVFLLASRYCETEPLMNVAWQNFGHVTPGWTRVQAVCDWVNRWIAFGYHYARPTKTAWDVFNEREGVCRDFAHLAITLCRCLNIPARYCTGYLGDIGVPPADCSMDFAGWMEAYIGGQWHTFDPRNNARRIGRILMGRGRDAADVALTTTFGGNNLEIFRVWTDEHVIGPVASAAAEHARRAVG